MGDGEAVKGGNGLELKGMPMDVEEEACWALHGNTAISGPSTRVV